LHIFSNNFFKFCDGSIILILIIIEELYHIKSVNRLMYTYNMLHRLLGLQRKAYVANYALQHFACNEWKFDNTNSRYLMSLIPSDNLEMFSIDLSDMDWNEYLR